MQVFVSLIDKTCKLFDMIPKQKTRNQKSLFFSFEETLDSHHPLFILANCIDWSIFEQAFLPLYCQDNGRAVKPIRLMVGLLILKHLRNISDIFS